MLWAAPLACALITLFSFLIKVLLCVPQGAGAQEAEEPWL